MALDAVAVCNRALTFLGVSNITALTDDSKEAKACSQVFTECLWELLGEADWSFATKTVKLQNNGNTPTSGYSYEFDLPADFVRCLSDTQRSVAETSRWELVGGTIHSDSPEITLTYIHAALPVINMPAKVRTALAYLIASQIAISLTGSTELASLSYQLYEKTLTDALAADAGTKRYQPTTSAPYISVRW